MSFEENSTVNKALGNAREELSSFLMLATKFLNIWCFTGEQASRHTSICKASVLGHTMPFSSSMFTKEAVIPDTSSEGKDCIERINENLIAPLVLYSGNYTLMAGVQAFNYALKCLHNIWVSFKEVYYLR